MSFKDQLEEDLNVFMNPDEFGDVALFSKSGLDINIIIDKDIDTDTGRIIDVVIAKKSDIEEISVGDTFKVASTTYRCISSTYQPIDELTCLVRVEK